MVLLTGLAAQPLTATVAMPVFGVQNTLLFVVSLTIMSLIVLVSLGHEEA